MANHLTDQMNIEVEEKQPLVVTNKAQYRWNIVNEATFRATRDLVFDVMAQAVSNTYGPYGAPTIIDNGTDAITSTKDGWNVIKGIRFNDLTANSIAKTVRDICHRAVMEVGDGSTTAIVGASKTKNRIQSSEILDKARSKDVLEAAAKIADIITAEIESQARKIDGDYEIIERIAYVSSNGSEEISRIMREIYEKTNNPTIAFEMANIDHINYSITEGYKSSMYLIDKIYANRDKGICELENPLFLLVDHKLIAERHMNDGYKGNIIGEFERYAMERNQKLVICAPYYDNFAQEKIRKRCQREMRQCQETNNQFNPNTIFMHIPTFSSEGVIDYQDFAAFTGATILTQAAVEDKGEELINPEEYVGTVDNFQANSKFTMITGFSNSNQAMLTKLRETVQDEVDHQELTVKLTGEGSLGELYRQRNRLIKLSGKLSLIRVGGDNELVKRLNYDSIEDVVKACESAFKYGYSTGGSIVIPVACNKILEERKDLSIIERELIKCIGMAFKEVFGVVLGRIYDSPQKIADIINESVEKCECYDAVAEAWTGNVINPAKTDIAVLRATLGIITLLFSANQYITTVVDQPLDYEGNTRN